MTIYVSVCRERAMGRQARFRATIHRMPGTRPVFLTSSKLGSVQGAQREAESVLGELEWSEPSAGSGWDEETRLVAAIEWET